ncbi:MAG: CPBP family intramembrane metalloprotease [Propionibacteriaceae bacterium]|nr:CPBP family intramembrane metalloprotease [Propionibacteriaceae bacterium]
MAESYPPPPSGWVPQSVPPGAATPPPGWYPAPIAPAAPPPALPVVPREYHEFYRAPRFRWWRPLVALGMFAGSWFVVTMVLSLAALAYELAVGSLDLDDMMTGELTVTPMLFLANNLALAAAIPLAWAAHRAVFGQRIGWLSSIAGRFRWGIFGRFAALVVICYLVITVIEIALTGWPEDLAVRPETGFLLVSVLLTTPLQAAGEEFALRGLGARAIGSWFSGSRAGLVVSTAITATVFMLLHGAGDPWLNVYYFYFGVVACVLTWRTGGLEAAVALHVVNNLAGLAWVPFMGVEGLFDRDAGVGSPLVLLQMAAVAIVAAGMLRLASRAKLSGSAAPGQIGVAWGGQGQNWARPPGGSDEQ